MLAICKCNRSIINSVLMYLGQFRLVQFISSHFINPRKKNAFIQATTSAGPYLPRNTLAPLSRVSLFAFQVKLPIMTGGQISSTLNKTGHLSGLTQLCLVCGPEDSLDRHPREVVKRQLEQLISHAVYAKRGLTPHMYTKLESL